MGAIVTIGTDNVIGLAEVENESKLMPALYKAIDCELVEVVKPRGLERPYVMIVDEEGIPKGRRINLLGSVLYFVPNMPASPIVGNIAIIKANESNTDIVSLTAEEALSIIENLTTEYTFLKEEEK